MKMPFNNKDISCVDDFFASIHGLQHYLRNLRISLSVTKNPTPYEDSVISIVWFTSKWANHNSSNTLLKDVLLEVPKYFRDSQDNLSKIYVHKLAILLSTEDIELTKYCLGDPNSVLIFINGEFYKRYDQNDYEIFNTRNIDLQELLESRAFCVRMINHDPDKFKDTFKEEIPTLDSLLEKFQKSLQYGIFNDHISQDQIYKLTNKLISPNLLSKLDTMGEGIPGKAEHTKITEVDGSVCRKEDVIYPYENVITWLNEGHWKKYV